MNEEEIFQVAADMAAPERAACLAAACEGRPALRERVERLLASHDDGGFMKRSVDRIDSAELKAKLARLRPEIGEDRIGHYKLLQQIGEGGFGTVWMAEQLEPVRRHVALKIIKPGMDSKEVLVRFEQERQALALMDHPNIAKVLDAGVAPLGRPFFVMELVRGIRITDFCDQNNLPTAERLALFIAVCNAIQHAHQKGIIHRDIKPSNILVTLHDGVPVPKVIDFGVAKAIQSQRLTDLTFFTRFEQMIGTPLYMSPEQAEMSGMDVDTRSDIYSLGVLLYELLTGTTPFDAKELMALGIDAIRKTIREMEPVRPSTRVTQELVAADVSPRKSTSGLAIPSAEEGGADSRRRLRLKEQILRIRGDLDWIVMKCLEKDRSRRYDTANGLATDLKRHLNNEPVIARPPSTAYKFQKTWRRNRLAFTAAAAVLCALILGVVVSTWQAVRATQAEREQSRLRQEAEGLRANEARLRREAEARATIIQVNFLLIQGKFDEADRLIGEAPLPSTQPTLEGAAALRALGEWHAVGGRWREAASRFAAALQVNHFDQWGFSTMDFLKCGPLLIELGDVEGYERLRQTAITRFVSSENTLVSERIVKVSLLLPANDEVIRSLAPLATVQAKKDFGPLHRSQMAAWESLSFALMEYRRSNYTLAVEWCGRCLAFPPDSKVRIATARIVLAMSRHQLYHADAAEYELAQGREIIESKFRSGLGLGEDILGQWFDWLIARILLREATALIDVHPSGSINLDASMKR